MYCGPLSERHWIACGVVDTVSPMRAQTVLSHERPDVPAVQRAG